MYYIIQENVFKEENYDNLLIAINRLGLSYEIVKVLPFVEDIEFKTKRKDVFPFGCVKLARVSKKYGWYPGSQLNKNHDYLIYKKYYKKNLLNYDSKIYKFGEDFFNKEIFFARPTEDSKVFTGKVFDMETWKDFREYALNSGHSTTLDKDTKIQVSSVKKIQQEFRFWIVKGKIITASQYKLGNLIVHNNIIDESVYDFCNKMIDIFQLNKAFVMDICLVDGEYKIIECGCINCAGFYNADLQKLLMSIEENF